MKRKGFKPDFFGPSIKPDLVEGLGISQESR